MKKHTEVFVKQYPACDICGEPAHYDAKSKQGPWGYFCQKHFVSHTWGKLGLGLGQKLILSQEVTK